MKTSPKQHPDDCPCCKGSGRPWHGDAPQQERDGGCQCCKGKGRVPAPEAATGPDGQQRWGRTRMCRCLAGWRLACESAEADNHRLLLQLQHAEAQRDEYHYELEQLRAKAGGAGKYHKR